MRKKIIEWIWRYGPAEIVAITVAIVVGQIVFHKTGNQALTVYSSSLSETLFFYCVILLRDFLKIIQPRKAIDIITLVRNLLVEFGPAELIDTFAARPFCMYVFISITHDLSLGIALGKIVSDIAFYIPTIISYELRKKHLP